MRSGVLAALAMAGSMAVAATAQTGESPSRYPFDPVCPWGRLANGQGMLVRCLSATESKALRAGAPVAPASAAAPSASAAAPAESAVAPPTAPSGSAAPAPAAPPEVSVGEVTVSDGKLPLAHKKLQAPKERYAKCIADHGGMSAASATASLKFLVRERARAEGVQVAEAKGMSREAAKCIADVVDRRWVGVPDAPIVTVTVVISASKK